MPNNLQILAYVQAMIDRTSDAIKYCETIERNNKHQITNLSTHLMHLKDLQNLEKFIKEVQ